MSDCKYSNGPTNWRLDTLKRKIGEIAQEMWQIDPGMSAYDLVEHAIDHLAWYRPGPLLDSLMLEGEKFVRENYGVE